MKKFPFVFKKIYCFFTSFSTLSLRDRAAAAVGSTVAVTVLLLKRGSFASAFDATLIALASLM